MYTGATLERAVQLFGPAIMSDTEEWSFPKNLQPNTEDVSFELDAVLDAVVNVRAEIPEDAFTASILGTERVGNGVVIRAPRSNAL